MKFSRLFILMLVGAVAFSACKKDETTESLPYMNGAIQFPVPAYMEPSESVTFGVDTLTTLYLNEPGSIGYFVKYPLTSTRDTIKTLNGGYKVNEITVVAPEDLGTYSATYGAYADGYNEASVTSSFTVVKKGLNGESSLTNFNLTYDDIQRVFTDPRDGRAYYYNNIEGVDWMRQNLAWDGAGYPESGVHVIGEILGRYYTWDEAQTACPEGWRLPTEEDWVALGKKYGTEAEAGKDFKGPAGSFMEDVYFNGVSMWDYWRDVKIDNAARLSFLPTGFVTVSDGVYVLDGKNSYAMFWSADSEDDMGAYRYIYESQSDLFYGVADKKSFAINVRCVR